MFLACVCIDIIVCSSMLAYNFLVRLYNSRGVFRMELLSDEGYRFDGRKPSEFRRIRGRLGVFDHADGSAILQQVHFA